MAKLNREESILLVKLLTRAQNKLKGEALDMARMALPVVMPEDRQFNQFTKTLKSKEQGLRHALVEALVEAGILERVEEEAVQAFK